MIRKPTFTVVIRCPIIHTDKVGSGLELHPIFRRVQWRMSALRNDRRILLLTLDFEQGHGQLSYAVIVMTFEF
jgi:hypothetical protein